MEIELQESGLVSVNYLPELNSQLANLDEQVSAVIESRLGVHSKINDYRTYLSNVQGWLDQVANKLDPLEKGGRLTLVQKKDYADQILKELENGAPKVQEVKSSAEAILPSLSNVDAQLVEEQLKGVDRRYGEMKKRLSRKKQILENTLVAYQDFKVDSDQVSINWRYLISNVAESKF
jgi:nesprin-1